MKKPKNFKSATQFLDELSEIEIAGMITLDSRGVNEILKSYQ